MEFLQRPDGGHKTAQQDYSWLKKTIEWAVSYSILNTTETLTNLVRRILKNRGEKDMSSPMELPYAIIALVTSTWSDKQATRYEA